VPDDEMADKIQKFSEFFYFLILERMRMSIEARPTINYLFNLIKFVWVLSIVVFVFILVAKIGFGFSSIFAPMEVQAMPMATPVVAPTVTVTSEVTDSPSPFPSEEAVVPSTPVPLTPATAAPTAISTPDAPSLIAGRAGVNVRRGPSTYHEKFAFLEPGAHATITGRYNDWWQIDVDGEAGWVYSGIVTVQNGENVAVVSEFPTPEAGYAPDTILPPTTPEQIDETRWIDVDLSEQTLRAYENDTIVQTYLVSTGLPATPTPNGQFRIWIKFRTDDMAGANYYIKDVPWVMYFYQGYGLHGVTWHANFGHPMSHGCVNQPNDMAEWLFNFAEVGTLVNIHD
jgi:lipoprotein-anchoring transpeptidase ErfK/SrfK